jgi:hypothetical protein
VELQGLDVPEMGVQGYINEDPKTPEGHLTHALAEPRPAAVPNDGLPRYSLVVEGLAPDKLATIWANLCKPSKEAPSKEFLLVYPHMTTVKGNRFRFRGGDPKLVREGLASLLVEEVNGEPVKVHVET